MSKSLGFGYKTNENEDGTEEIINDIQEIINKLEGEIFLFIRHHDYKYIRNSMAVVDEEEPPQELCDEDEAEDQPLEIDDCESVHVNC